MHEQLIQVVLIEDNPDDVNLIKAILSESSYITSEFHVAVRLIDALNLLNRLPSADIILLDLFLPDSHGLATISALHGTFPDIPIIVLTTWDEAEIAVQAVQHGAQDYLIKDQLEFSSFLRAIRYAIERARVEQKLRQQRDEMAQLAEERAILLEQERQARARAESANELKGKFVSMVSHELRTPLTSINGFANTLLLPNLNLSATQRRELFTILHHETESMCVLVDQLIDVAKMQAGMFTVSQQPVRVEDIMSRAAQSLEALAANHRLQLEIPSALPFVIADEERIVQVLRNLVHNAAKYAPRNSEIRVFAMADQSHSIEFDIADEGPGIPLELRERLFEPFLKAEQYRLSTRNSGMGLGLAICHGIIEAHRGKIWIANSTAPGTTVSFTLPTEQSPVFTS